MIGKTAPAKMIAAAAASVRCSHTIAKGIHAIGGIGRKSSMIGVRARSSTRNQPVNAPSGTPTTSAKNMPLR